MSADPAAAALAALLAGASFEIPPRDARALAALAGAVARGTEICIAFPPSWSHHDVADTARAVRAAGCVPVPHVAARSFAGRPQLDEFLARITGEAGVDRVLLIGGDTRVPRGPFAQSLDVIEAGALERHAIRHVGLAAHPEGSPHADAAALRAALAAKLAGLARRGLTPWLVTQFCFEPAPILAMADDLRRLAPGVRVRVGIAGPASVGTLLRFAMRCGIGASLRALQTRTDSIVGLLGDRRPDALLRALATAAPPLDGLHIFPFGGLAATRAWIDDLLRSSGR